MRIVPPLAAALLVELAAAAARPGDGHRVARRQRRAVVALAVVGLLLVDGLLPGGRALDVTWTLVIEMLFYALTFVVLTGAPGVSEVDLTGNCN